MDGNTGLIIFYIVFGFFAFVLICASVTMFIIWRRRKLTFTNFLTDRGQWERTSWMPNKIGKTFEYDGEMYNYDISKCTHDTLNRPIAHYYKGNPEQQEFNFSLTNKKITIVTKEITAKDFMVLMMSKVLRDIFQDEEVMTWLMIIAGLTVLMGVVVIIVTATHNPAVTLKDTNETTMIIARAVKYAITNKVV